jgi:hypothetical protein
LIARASRGVRARSACTAVYTPGRVLHATLGCAVVRRRCSGWFPLP